mgnify:CR=1 FL=1
MKKKFAFCCNFMLIPFICSSRRRHTRCREVSWARRCVKEKWAKIKVPSLKGELELEIPKNVKDKQQFTFKNEGVKSVQGYGKGDLIVQVKIEYPKTLTNEQKELLEKLQDSFGVESTPSEIKFEGMFDKVKKWFS